MRGLLETCGGRREWSLTVGPSRWNGPFLLAVCILSLFGLTLCATGCFRVQFIGSKNTLPTMCSAFHPPSIGKDLFIGESSDEVLSKVGKPNKAIEENGYIYYVYFVQPYLLWEWDLKFLNVCHSQPVEDSTMYYITFDPDEKVQSILYYIVAGADSQRVKLPGADGLLFPATLYSPRGCGTARKAGLIFLHGWLSDGDTDTRLEGYADLIAEQGYIVLAPLMRGWGGGQNDCGRSQSADIARAVDWLASQPEVDPDRIGLVGFSFGGQVALLTGARNHRLKAIVSYAGPTNFATFNAQLPWYESLPNACRSDLKSHSPITVASQIKAPVLLIHGDIDATVPIEQAEEMELAMWKSNGNVRKYVVTAGHYNSFIPAWPATQQFLEATLGKRSCVQTVHPASPSAEPTPRTLESR
jgi:dienelactone hydrolase